VKLKVNMPFDQIEPPDAFLKRDFVVEIAQCVERLGFAGVTVTDHPCPTGRWLDAGGHHAQDPFVLLSMIAAVTQTLELHTGILVLPYRNPFITARSVATLDVFSGGRVKLGIGAGYLKAEFRALGVDFEKRNDLTDEYLRAMKAAWTANEFTFEGTGYQALGNRILPRPVQKPHPTLIIGGNSKRAIRRSVDLGDAWGPFFTKGALSATSRTVAMESEEDLEAGIQYMRDYSAQVGRNHPPEIILSGVTVPGESLTPSEYIDRIGRFSELGIAGASVSPGAAATAQEFCDGLERFASDVLSKLPGT
jgi:probable F420-dependent oxidoreductase